jgi:tetratricopeptide (TPR) repeat protein
VRRLWQVPMFVLGVIAAVLVLCHARQQPQAPADRLAAGLRAALDALEEGDSGSAIEQAKDALELVDHAPHLAGELKFVLGSAYLHEAADGTAAERAEKYTRARLHLQQAKQLGVAPAHEPRLEFRLIAAEFHTGMDPATLATQLGKLLEANDADRVEGYALLVQMHLKKSVPDLQAALHANEKLLAQGGLTNPNPARLQRGQLLLQLNRKEEARAILARIPPDAPEYFAARSARALSAYEDEQWQEAAALWEEAGRHGVEDAVQERQGLYYLGHCYAHLGRTRDALTAWHKLVDQMPGSEEAVAAAFQMAEAHHAAGQEDHALVAFVTALQQVPPGQSNRYLEISVLRRMVEEAWSRWHEAKEYFRARELAVHYRKISLPGEADRRLGQTCLAAGQAKLREAELSAGRYADDLYLAARQRFAEAGEAFEIVARQREGEADHADWLWTAAENFLKAQEYARVIVLLERYLTPSVPAARRAETLVSLAEAHQALGHQEQALKLLREVLANPAHPPHPNDPPLPPLGRGGLRGGGRARYLLALVAVDQGKFAEAEATLREILALPGVDPEPPEIRQAHFALGYVLHHLGQYSEASGTLEAALARYPRHPQGLQARYWLAEAYRQSALEEADRLRAADTDSAREFYRARKQTQFERALANYRQLAFDLAERQAAAALKPELQELLRRARLDAGDCLVSLGRHDEAVDVYEKLAENHPNHPDGLMALLQLAQCQLSLGKGDKAKGTLERCRMTLSLLTPADFEPPHPTRLQWLQWIEAVAKASQSKP